MGVTKPRSDGVSQSLRMTDYRSKDSSDQEAIADWVSDLSRLAESLGVRSATPAWPPLTAHFQDNYPRLVTRAIFPGFLDNIIDTHAIVSNGSHTQTLCSPSDPHISLDRAPQPSTVCPTPGPSTPIEAEVSACIRLATRAFSPHEHISLIEDIFTRKDEVKMVGYLGRDAAQAFIDVVHEVRLAVLHFRGAA